MRKIFACFACVFFILQNCIVHIPFVFAEADAMLEVKTSANVDGRASTQKSQTVGGKNVETVVETLNATLQENRLLREKNTKAESDIANVKTQNNLLSSQIRQMQVEIEKLKKDSQGKDAEVKKQLEELSQEKAKFAEEKEKSNEAKSEIDHRYQSIEEENERLRTLLEGSVLKGEEESYQKIIEEASKTGKRSVHELAKAKRESEQFKKELAEQYYTLGNLMFEKQNYRGAIKKYRQTLKMNSQDAWAHHNLAVIYDFYISNNAKAIFHYRKYLDLKPIKEDARQVRERVLSLELGKLVVPRTPLRNDFDQYQKELKIKT